MCRQTLSLVRCPHCDTIETVLTTTTTGHGTVRTPQECQNRYIFPEKSMWSYNDIPLKACRNCTLTCPPVETHLPLLPTQNINPYLTEGPVHVANSAPAAGTEPGIGAPSVFASAPDYSAPPFYYHASRIAKMEPGLDEASVFTTIPAPIHYTSRVVKMENCPAEPSVSTSIPSTEYYATEGPSYSMPLAYDLHARAARRTLSSDLKEAINSSCRGIGVEYQMREPTTPNTTPQGTQRVNTPAGDYIRVKKEPTDD